MTRKRPLLLLAAFLVTGLAWATLRINIESRLAETAQRDLHAIVDLVASEIENKAATSPLLKRAELAQAVAGSHGELRQTLQRVSAEQLRKIYFFDASGRVVTAGDNPSEGTLESERTTQIVRSALESRHSAERGALADPYPDLYGTEVIGAWRWLSGPELGIVAERPYAGIGSPLRWVDGVFLVMFGLLVVGALLTSLPPTRELLSAFRSPDIRRCGPYLIERRIGEGAMANVYLARHRHLNRVVALKLLKGGAQTDELSARFDREAKLASQLSHPNIVTVFDRGRVPEGGFFYAMEYIHGLTLPQWVQEHGPIVPARSVRILQQVCAAVGAIHRAGFLHRDIKPDNVMVFAANEEYDLVKLIDFGLAKNIEGGDTRDLTRNLRVLGTPAYMAPERLQDPRSIDRRTDLYGIGCIAFFLLTGRKPFESTRHDDLAQQILHVESPLVSTLSPFPIPEHLDSLIAATLAKDMAMRPRTAEAMAAELDEISRLVPWRRELARLWWRSAFSAFSRGVPPAAKAP